MQLLILLGILFGYIFLSVFVTVLLVNLTGRAGAQRRGKLVVAALGFLIFVLIPTWDFLPGQLYFAKLCEKEGGLRIYRTVEGVEGFLLDGKRGEVEAKEFLDLGYSFIEAIHLLDDKLYRYMRTPNGAMVRQPVEQSTSRYALVHKVWQPLPWDIEKNEYAIIHQETQERMAEFRNFYYSGNWALSKIRQELHYPCPSVVKPHLINDFLLKTLRPLAAGK